MDAATTIVGHRWDDIQRAQQGGTLGRPITGPINRPLATPEDLELLESHGEAQLGALGYWGVLDRLRNSGVLP